MSYSPASRARLTSYDLPRFSGPTLFDRVARAVCRAGCLPRKELYEAWEMARRVRRRCRGGRIVDLAGGHGLLALMLLVLDDRSPSALVVDRAIPPSARAVLDALGTDWPWLGERVSFVEADLGSVPLGPEDLVVSSHACGALTDAILARAAAARARVAVLPCCHDLQSCDAGPLAGWMDGPLAIDAVRALRLQEQAYRVWTAQIPPALTPKNRLLIGVPGEERPARAAPALR